jgi:hypothetical protein
VDAQDPNVDLFFRVRTPAGASKINVYGDGNLIKSLPKLRVAPSEMESVRLKREDIKNYHEITISVQEVK